MGSKKWVLLSVCTLMSLLLFGSMVFAQKPFEGIWEQTTITETQTPMGNEVKTEKQKVYYEPGKMMIENVETGDLVIIRADKGVIWQVNKKEGTYTEVTFAQIEEAGKQAKAAMAAMKERMKSLSPEQREMMQKMMGEQMPSLIGNDEGKITLKKTGETKNIGGYKCKHIIISSDNTQLMDMWVTDKLQLGEDYLKFYQKFGVFKSGFMEKMREVGGFVLQSKFAMNTPMSKVTVTTTVTKIIPQSVCSCTFKLPPGLKKKEIPMMPSK